MASVGGDVAGDDWNDGVMDVTTLHVLLVIFFATLIRSAFGFGEALFAVPLLALRLPLGIGASRFSNTFTSSSLLLE